MFRALLYPAMCSGCAERGTWLCDRCRTEVPALADPPSTCRKCGIPVFRGRCGCSNLHSRVTRTVSVYPYTGWVANAVRGVKFDSERDHAAFLGGVLAQSTAGALLQAADVVVPMPMHPKCEHERGYNQAALLAEGACQRLGIRPPEPVSAQQVERPSQIGVSSEERRRNVRGAFSVSDHVALRPGMRLVLVDDGRTTGATLMAAVEAMRVLRPARIDVVTLAAELGSELEAQVMAMGRHA